MRPRESGRESGSGSRRPRLLQPLSTGQLQEVSDPALAARRAMADKRNSAMNRHSSIDEERIDSYKKNSLLHGRNMSMKT